MFAPTQEAKGVQANTFSFSFQTPASMPPMS